jgi:hypothetical protein
MGSTVIIAAIDKELARLQVVRAKLALKLKKQSGDAPAAKKKAKRQLSPAGRAKFAEAQRKRWAVARKGKNKR